jgi:hypothetical protein
MEIPIQSQSATDVHTLAFQKKPLQWLTVVDVIAPWAKCNDPVFYDSAVEVFLAQGHDVPHNYTEMDMSPNGVLFASRIYNPEWTCNGMSGTINQIERFLNRLGTTLNCASTGIVWTSQQNPSNNTWWAYYQIPFSLIDTEV